jgi:phospholipase D
MRQYGVRSFVLTLVSIASLGVALPAAAQSTGAVSVCFAPEQDCAAFAVRAIDDAHREILVHAYGLTTGAGIVEALVRAKGRGVDVAAIVDRRTPGMRHSGVDALLAAGVPVWIDKGVPRAHEKAIIIDGERVLAGSYNWTSSAADNSEDLALFAAPAIAELYMMHWLDRLAEAMASPDHLCAD